MISQWRALTSTCILHYQVQSLLCLYDLEELDWRRRKRGKDREMRWRGRSKVVGDGARKKQKRIIIICLEYITNVWFSVSDDIAATLTYVGVIQHLHDPHLTEELLETRNTECDVEHTVRCGVWRRCELYLYSICSYATKYLILCQM